MGLSEILFPILKSGNWTVSLSNRWITWACVSVLGPSTTVQWLSSLELSSSVVSIRNAVPRWGLLSGQVAWYTTVPNSQSILSLSCYGQSLLAGVRKTKSDRQKVRLLATIELIILIFNDQHSLTDLSLFIDSLMRRFRPHYRFDFAAKALIIDHGNG